MGDVATIIGIGKSVIGDAMEAGFEAAQKALLQLNGASPVFALIFASAGYDQNALFEGINKVIGDIPSSGCSGEGVITPDGADEGSAIVGIMLFAGTQLKFRNYFACGLGENSYGCGQSIVKEFNEFCATKNLSENNSGTLIVLADALTVNITELFNAFDDHLQTKPLIVGGTAGDMMQLKKTYQYYNGKAYSDAITVVQIFGDYGIDWMVTHGCEEIGLEQTITKADKNNVVEIDGQRAWDMLRKYLPHRPETLSGEDSFHFCLGELHHFAPPIGDKLVVRTAMGMEPQTGALKFSVEMPVGTKFFLTRRDPEVISKNVLDRFHQLLERNKGRKILAVLQFDCSGRGHVIYGNNLNKMIFEPLQKMLPPETPWIGFLTFGEIAPIANKVFYHNFTAVIVVLFEPI